MNNRHTEFSIIEISGKILTEIISTSLENKTEKK